MMLRIFTCLLFVSINAKLDIPSFPDLRAFQNIPPLNFLNADEFYNILSQATNKPPREALKNYGPYFKEEAAEGPAVEVPDLGIARGRVLKSFFGRNFFAFQSIPYAKPPVGELRFKMPEPWEGQWSTNDNGEYDATYFRAKCPQSSMILPTPGGREDCLHINIYTPDFINGEVPAEGYPVMFFIHGGSFLTGDGTLYTPTKLMDQDVIVVMVQYRLGSLGFLASLTPDNPGNMGLMDQIAALRWVNKYIEYFHGNADSVTVFGQSAGGASTSWLQFTTATRTDRNDGKQIMHRAIVESGSALEVWANDLDPHSSFITHAKAVDCWDEDASEPVADALSCMRDLPVVDIVHGFLKVYKEDRYNGGLGFIGASPVVQKELLINYPVETNNTDLAIITDQPINLINKGEFLATPIMMGSVRDEGSLVLGLAYTDFLDPHNLMTNETFLKIEMLPFLVDAFGIVDTTGAVSNSFQLTFLENALMGNWTSMSGGLVDLTGMLFLKTGLWSLAQRIVLKNPDMKIYFYSFEFESDDSLFQFMFLGEYDLPIKGGITHADELLYIFALPALINDERQELAVKRIAKLWTNFAKCGNPTPMDMCGTEWEGDVDEWMPINLDNLPFMLMSDEFKMNEDFTSRWTHNIIRDPCPPSNKTDLLQKLSNIETKERADQKNEIEEWKVATLAMAAACFLLILSLLYVLLKLKH